ncbi:MAG: Uma2 family endonuclease, partial [Actinomycetia bacterium]|nr:Uma2 family endonuclease [Actinomycetes bacterium]
RRDLEVKLDLLEAARCPQYWVIDPEEISMRMWELAGDAYALTRHARGADLITVQRPVELTFRLEQLWPARQA